MESDALDTETKMAGCKEREVLSATRTHALDVEKSLNGSNIELRKDVHTGLPERGAGDGRKRL